MKKTILLTLILALQANFVHAVKTDMVIASVNNKAVTLLELKNRIDLAKSLINRKLSAVEFDMLKRQALEQLINEELKRQYATEHKISVSSNDLKKAIKSIEAQRKLESGMLLKNLPDSLKQTALNQIKDSIYDQKIIDKVIVPQVLIQNSQIERLLEGSISKAEHKEYNISQINIKYTPKSKKIVAKIYSQLLKGETFENVAQAFSQGAKGSLGWFSKDELNYNAQRELKSLSKGQFTKPFTDKDSWYIIKINDERTTKNIDLTQTVEYKFSEFKNNKLDDDTFDEIEDKIENMNGFNEFVDFSDKLVKDYKFKRNNVNWIAESELSKEQKEVLTKTKPSNFSELKHNKDDSVNFIYLLDKRLKNSDQVEKIKRNIEMNLKNKDAQLKFRTFLQTLRKNSFIEIR